MECPNCGGRGYCYATKPAGTVKQRYRKCRMCGHKFSTWEEVEDRKLRPYRNKQKSLDLFQTTESEEPHDKPV